jgi:SAM-dependent methyltransferase
MDWRLKAVLQNIAARMPSRLSHRFYYFLQRRFGGLSAPRLDPVPSMRTGLEFVRLLHASGRPTTGAVVFEVGTGWRINLPLVFWLAGAREIVTADVHPHFRLDLFARDLAYLRQHADRVRGMLREALGASLDEQRWRNLLAFRPDSLRSACAFLSLRYMAPADAAATGLPPESVDVHVSRNVLEHVPPATLRGIFREAARVTRRDGLMLHRVDHSDHFAHGDPALSAIHFLKYSPRQWRARAGNRLGYTNRLREDDYVALFAESCCAVRQVLSTVDERVATQLAAGFPMHADFATKPADVLARLHSLFVVEPARHAAGGAARRAA